MFLRLFLFTIASEGLYLLLAEKHQETIPFFLLWSGLFAAYALAIRAVHTKSGRALLFVILITSALFRGSLLVRVKGGPAEAPEAFLHAASPAGNVLALRPDLQKPVATAFDLAALALVPPLLRALSLPTGLALVYGWNPLLIKEAAASGRFEAIPLFFLLLAFLLLRTKRPEVAAIAYGASLAGPPFFWATLPLAARALGWHLILSLFVGAAAWAPLAVAKPPAELLGWPPEHHVGGSLLPAIEALAKLFVTRDPLAPSLFCAGLFVLLALARTWKVGRDGATLPREAILLLGCLLFLSPEVLPWAFVPIAGLAAFSENPGWIVATATAPLAYLTLGEKGWSFWLAFAQHFPVYASLIFVGLGGKQGKAQATRLPQRNRSRPRPTSRRGG